MVVTYTKQSLRLLASEKRTINLYEGAMDHLNDINLNKFCRAVCGKFTRTDLVRGFYLRHLLYSKVGGNSAL